MSDAGVKIGTTDSRPSGGSWLASVRFVLPVICLLVALYWFGRGHGLKMRVLNKVWTFHPWITGTRPENGESGVLPENFIATEVMLPNLASGVNADTLTNDSVRLYRSDNGKPVIARLNTTGAGDAIVLQPLAPLELNTSYTFEVTPAVKDTAGGAFKPYKMSFTTVANVHYDTFPAAFEQVVLPTAAGRFASMTIGPDHKLYAATFENGIERFSINPDGTLGTPQTIDTIGQANGGPRLIVGLRFDPSSTPDHLILWTTHSPPQFSGAEDWTGKISRLSGPNLENYQDVIVDLPRAAKDHVTLQMDFGPDGAIYFSQGSNTAMGAPDRKWGFRHEHLLTAAILRLDPGLLKALPLDVKTEAGGKYNPFAPGAPLTIYATGVRVAYQVLWHSNGHLYAGVNASAAHGNTPGTPASFAGLHRIDQELRGPYRGPAVPGIEDVLLTLPDYITTIEKGAYYGHPNPSRAEYVENGGNPTAGIDPWECPQYPVGTMPDRNWREPMYSCGLDISPNGMLEFHGKIFNGALDHKILITRYSGGKDIAILSLDSRGNITESVTGVDGLNRLADPLDIVEDEQSGFMYIDELGSRRITLVRPIAGGKSEHVLRQQVTAPALAGQSTTD